MPKKLNCWEFFNCGREKDGLMVPICGECPVSSAMKFDGLNEGVGAGRACWMVNKSAGCSANRSCDNKCHQCKFYNRVVFEQEEKTSFKYSSVS